MRDPAENLPVPPPPPWRQLLGQLEQAGAPMLPIGAGTDKKAPVNPTTGCAMTGWQHHPGYSASEIGAMSGAVIAAGIKTGGESRILALDVDGATASEWIRNHGVEPDELQTWRINRDTDPERYKLIYRLTAEQERNFPQTKVLVQTKHADKERGLKGEAVEVYFQPGAQVVVLGAHPSSNGNYSWSGSPAEIATADETVMDLLRALAAAADALRSKGDTSSPPRVRGATRGRWGASGPGHPCPICGRDTSGACTRSSTADGAEFASCYQGSTFEPPHPLQAGDTITGHDGRQWGFVREYMADGIGWKSLFKIHTPRPTPTPPLNGEPLIPPDAPRQAPEAAPPAATKRQQQQRGGWEARNRRKLSHTRAVACMEQCIQSQARIERNSLRRRIRLQKAAKDLGLNHYIKSQDISQKVLEAKLGADGGGFYARTAAERLAMSAPVVRWLIRGLVPAGDMTIIGGRPKVGKTRLAVALVAAVLNETGMLDMPPPTTSHPVVLVTDDQNDADTCEMLRERNLYDHPKLLWSSNFRLNETEIDKLLRTVQDHPGAVVVVDSLRSIGRALPHGENDPEIGAILYDLKQAITSNGGTLLLIHHCNKAMDLVGVEALSGHNAIAGAANTVITMHYLPGVNGQPNKAIPQRRIVREGRSGEGLDIVIVRDEGAGFRRVQDMHEWQAEVETVERLEKLTPMQEAAKGVLADADGWMTRRQVCEAMGIAWGDRGRSGRPRRVDHALRRLVALRVVESERSGTEASYRFSHGALETTVPTVPTSHTNGSQCHERNRDNRDNHHTPSALSRLSENAPNTENGCQHSLARLSRLSGASTPTHRIAGLAASMALIGSGADAMADDDDPTWGPRPQVVV